MNLKLKLKDKVSVYVLLGIKVGSQQMYSRDCMINLMADIIGYDDKYTKEKLNNGDIWEDFITDVFNRMDTIENESIRSVLGTVDRKLFQSWIDDQKFWVEIDAEIVRRGQFIKAINSSKSEGYC